MKRAITRNDGAAGGNVDINGDMIEIKGIDGESMTLDGTTWPDTETAKKIPEFKGGKITSVFSSNGGGIISFEEVDQQAALSCPFHKRRYHTV